jgi:hypothetical protein
LLADILTSAASGSPAGVDGRINGCYGNNGALSVVPAGSACSQNQTAISWVGQTLRAVVFSDGTLLTGDLTYGVSQVAPGPVTHPSTGLYDVYFSDPNAGACTQVASIADMTPGVISAYGGQVAPNVVQVQTADTSGNPADRTAFTESSATYGSTGAGA